MVTPVIGNRGSLTVHLQFTDAHMHVPGIYFSPNPSVPSETGSDVVSPQFPARGTDISVRSGAITDSLSKK